MGGWTILIIVMNMVFTVCPHQSKLLRGMKSLNPHTTLMMEVRLLCP